MEYDRALYRVYERVMEELSSSPSPVQNTTNNQQLPFCFPFLKIWKSWSFIKLWCTQQRGRYTLLTGRRSMSHLSDNSVGSSSSDTQQQHSSNPLYNHHAERMRIRMSLDRQSFLVRNSRHRSSNEEDEEVNESRNLVANTETTAPEREGEETPSSASSSDEEEMEQTIYDTVERIRATRERISRRENNNGNEDNRSCTQGGCWCFIQVCFIFAWFHVLVVCSLHNTYITQNTGTCIRSALQTRSLEERSNLFILRDHSDYGKKTNQNETAAKQENQTDSGHNDTANANDFLLLGDDEILQIKVLYGGKCTGQCSRIHYIQPDQNNTNTTSTTDPSTDQESSNEWKHRSINSDTFSTSEFWETIHYRYSTSEALLYLEQDLITQYNVTYVNITLTERCLSTGSDHGPYTFLSKFAQFLSPVYDMDTAIINHLIRALPVPPYSKDQNEKEPIQQYGYATNVLTRELWSWHRIKQSNLHRNFVVHLLLWTLSKLWSLFKSTVSFFLIISVTALVVRVLTSSGVVLMYPLFSLFRHVLPQNNAVDERILSLSYPWIGQARAAIRHARFYPVHHFIWSHACKILLFYVMYEACQAAWSVVLYGRHVPESIPIWIYGMAMIWEYFSMVFVRSAMSVYFFPRYTMMVFLAFHFYFLGSTSSPYPYTSTALIALFLFMLQVMIYTLLVCELPAFSRGSISLECPREVYSRVAWSEWSAALPHDFTLFLPLNSRYRSLYDTEVAQERQQQQQRQGRDGDHVVITMTRRDDGSVSSASGSDSSSESHDSSHGSTESIDQQQHREQDQSRSNHDISSQATINTRLVGVGVGLSRRYVVPGSTSNTTATNGGNHFANWDSFPRYQNRQHEDVHNISLLGIV